MKVVSFFVLLCCLVFDVYCGDKSCNAVASGNHARSLSFKKPLRRTLNADTTRWFFTYHAPYSRVTLVSTFDGSNGPLTMQQFQDSQTTFAKGLKNCEYCVFDCASTFIQNTNANAPTIYNYLFKDCEYSFYAYSCIKPQVVNNGNQRDITANTNCKSTSSLSEMQILGVLDICVTYNKCTFRNNLTRQQIINGFYGKNNYYVSNNIYTTHVNNDSGEIIYSMK
ncbi:hypothetical protein AKO1_005089 [Acrasis kona]|uniref:Uncharacterized protein n=1 Tax=Acrasis kona TaxID=1008807 RepID=A0AAW2Z5W4_9EUKA